jgi:hypothetical protein
MEKLYVTNKPTNQPELTYNANEPGCQLNNRPTKEMLAEREVNPYTPKLVNFLACTNAAGNFITPVAILKGKKC